MSTHGALAAPRGCTSFKLRQLTRRVSQQYDRVVGACGLKTTQYSLLSHIATLGPARPSDLAAAMAMDPSTLTRNLQPLIDHGWAEIGPGPDGRSRLVALTASGRDKRAEAQRAWKRAQLALNEQLGASRVAELHALLDDCLAALSAHPEEKTDA
jgi:DNA-binding MarR family transcriptional regulator